MGRLIDENAVKHRMHETMDYQDLYLPVHFEMCMNDVPTVEPSSPWHRVEEELPKEAGEYIVAYHPCWWNDVKTSVTEIGIDTFRGKTSWAKRKFQRVTHWMEKPEPPVGTERSEA